MLEKSISATILQTHKANRPHHLGMSQCLVGTSKKSCVSHRFRVQRVGGPHKVGSTMSEVCCMSAVHKLRRSGEASGDGCVLKVRQRQICQSALPFSVSALTPVTPPPYPSILPLCALTDTHRVPHYLFSVGICYSPSSLHLSSFSFCTSSVTR